MTVDREQVRRVRKIEHVLCNCECRHAQTAHEALAELRSLLAELEQAENEMTLAQEKQEQAEREREPQTDAEIVEAIREHTRPIEQAQEQKP